MDRWDRDNNAKADAFRKDDISFTLVHPVSHVRLVPVHPVARCHDGERIVRAAVVDPNQARLVFDRSEVSANFVAIFSIRIGGFGTKEMPVERSTNAPSMNRCLRSPRLTMGFVLPAPNRIGGPAFSEICGCVRESRRRREVAAIHCFVTETSSSICLAKDDRNFLPSNGRDVAFRSMLQRFYRDFSEERLQLAINVMPQFIGTRCVNEREVMPPFGVSQCGRVPSGSSALLRTAD